MSMKWVGRLKDNLQHDPNEKPSESPTTAIGTVRPSIHQVGIASYSQREYKM